MERDQWMRGGTVYRAANVNPVTARSWTKTVKLELGYRQGDGHPKYDIVDAVALDVMRTLTTYMQVAAQSAANITNRLRPLLIGVIGYLEQEHAKTGEWRWTGGPYAVVTGRTFDKGNWLHIVDQADLVDMIDRHQGLRGTIVLKLPAHLNAVRYRLQSIAAGDMMDEAVD